MTTLRKLRNIKAIFTDVDGVLTDGGMYCNADGLLLKKFHTRDVGAVYRLRVAGIKFFVLTASDDELTRKRIDRMLPDEAIYGIVDKLKHVKLICDKYGFDLSEVAYIGDDVIDRDAMMAVGMSICPLDALESIKGISNRICQVRGGAGVLAWVVDKIFEEGGSG